MKKLVESLTGPLAPRRGVAARLPGANGGKRATRVAKAEPPHTCKCRGVRLIRHNEDRGRADRLRQLLEQSAVMGLDALEGVDERVTEGVGVGKARQPGDSVELPPVGRDDMRLLVANHLQPVLDAAEKEIGFGQFAGSLARDPAAFSQAFECLDGAARPKLRVPASGDKLLGLGEEFDVADAAPPELDVVASDSDGAMAFELVHSALHRVNVGDSGVVEIFAPDERRELAQELLARLAVARSNSRLD